jgi:hypothetical protein
MGEKIKALQRMWNALSFETKLILVLDGITLVCTVINVGRILQKL